MQSWGTGSSREGKKTTTKTQQVTGGTVSHGLDCIGLPLNPSLPNFPSKYLLDKRFRTSLGWGNGACCPVGSLPVLVSMTERSTAKRQLILSILNYVPATSSCSSCLSLRTAGRDQRAAQSRQVTSRGLEVADTNPTLTTGASGADRCERVVLA